MKSIQVFKFLMKASEETAVPHKRFAFRKAAFSFREKYGNDAEVSADMFIGVYCIGPKIKSILESLLTDPIQTMNTWKVPVETLGLTPDTKYNRVDSKIWIPVVNEILKELPVVLAGSLRRKSLTIKDLDFVCTESYEYLIECINDFNNYSSIKLEIAGDGHTMVKVLIHNGELTIPADIKLVYPDEIGPAMLHLTGSANLNIKMRGIAKSFGWKLNEYGLFDQDNNRLDQNTEESIFELLGMDYIPPELRNY